MKKITNLHLLYIAGGVLLFVLVLLAPHMDFESRQAIAESKSSHKHSDNEAHPVDEGKEKVDAPITKSEHILLFEKKLSDADDSPTKLNLLDSLIEMAIKEKNPPLVAHYTEQKAITEPSVKNWFASGDNYFKAYRLTEGRHSNLIKKAVESYQKVLELDPQNVAAETALGVAYIEGAGDLGVMPMKGIGILLNILEKNPNNVNVLTNLGYFAIQSGQFEAAIGRFEKILELEPQNAEAYLYLTDAYVRMGEKGKAIDNLEKYKSFVDDPLVEQQVDRYIEDIRNK